MSTKSFRIKWALGILVLISAFIGSQAIYRGSITWLHDDLLAAAQIAEQMHGAEKFHSAMHLMLIAAAGYTETGNETFRSEFTRERGVARTSLAAMAERAQEASAHAHGTGDLNGDFVLYDRALDEVMTAVEGNRDTAAALLLARELFDSTFSHFYSELHQRHEADLKRATASAHRIRTWTSALFFVQFGLAVLFGVLGLFYLDRIAKTFLSVAEHMALTDGLTGVFNRRFLDSALEEELSRGRRHGHPVTVAMVDIDHFKRFNDRHGHQAGDRILRGLTQLMRQYLRAEDRIARYGGEEFMIILPETALGDGALAAEKLRWVTEEHLAASQGADAPVTVSIGLAAFPVDGATPTELIRAADERLYRAKAAGRNRVVPAVPIATPSVVG